MYSKISYVAGMLMVIGLSQGGVMAQETDDAFNYLDIRPLRLQEVPRVFKFQARVSQAKLPVGNVTFETIYVGVLRGNDTLVCSEEIHQVGVKDSVLNIDIGRGMNAEGDGQVSCSLADLIAQDSDLKFQICIKSPENCLTPIPLASVPYAVKADVAITAEVADRANRAVHSHYTHRAAADLATLYSDPSMEGDVSSEKGTGYHDFSSPSSEAPLSGLSVGEPDPLDGYFSWTPVNGHRKLHICSNDITGSDGAGSDSTGKFMALDELSLHAQKTSISGELEVARNVIINGDLEVKGTIVNDSLSDGGGGLSGVWTEYPTWKMGSFPNPWRTPDEYKICILGMGPTYAVYSSGGGEHSDKVPCGLKMTDGNWELSWTPGEYCIFICLVQK